MTASVTSAVLASVVCLTVGIAIAFRRPFRTLYTRFAAFTFAIFFWNAGAFIEGLTGHTFAGLKIWAALFIPPTLILFFAEMLRARGAFVKRITQFSYIATLTFFLILLSPLASLFVTRFLIAVYVIGAGLCVLKLLRDHRTNARSDIEKTRLSYLFFGGLITLLLASGDLLPASPLPSALAHLALTFYVYFLYQGLVSHRLMNMVELLGKAAVVGVLSLILSSIYSILVLWVGEEEQSLWIFNTIVASFVILILFEPIKRFVEDTTEKILFRQQYELRQSAQSLTQRLRTTIRVDTMQSRILETFQGQAAHGSVYVRDAGDEMSLRRVGSMGQTPPLLITLSKHPSLLQELRSTRRPILLEEVTYRAEDLPLMLTNENPALQREMERTQETISSLQELEAQVMVPMLSGDKMVGVFALGGPGMTRLSTDDLTAFLSLGEAAAIVVENSQEYEKRRERDRLVEIGEMATGMAHEIRNPLGAIKGAAQCLDPEDLPEESQEFVDVIIEEVDRLGNVVGQFLNYARPYRGDPVPTDINQVISQTVKLFTHAKLAPDLMIVQDLTHDLPPVELDPEQLKQVLLNLMRNAVEAMPEAGELTLKTTIDHAPVFTKSGLEDRNRGLENANLQIKVIDTGEGIPADQLKRIFLPFFTTKTQGTGLGLAICQRMVENSGGRLEVSSQVGVGTTFTLRFKVSQESAAH
ncbi:MAG: hypothetical protein HOI23_14915 [Deltaproteobacteria bacterium]|nr:hypothetical protein [Deltaproteobacteria bacterium]MBT6435131.1 hypothetical protein [Deltaproteobacteria bacterium]MBT6491027.1 hypothetical protein [Deltaproteobacteria bacterium]